jgi:peptidoglycan/xylan/chitin deacetylase (PgdA/CDA1 family)
MNLYPVKTPAFFQSLFPNVTWNISTNQNEIYLTFDDGPIPELTPWVLDLLSRYNAKATFFCVGDNIVKYPEIFKRIISEGHGIGNHSFNHLNGWNTNNEAYFKNIQKNSNQTHSILFRPPYGKMTFSQFRWLKNHYQLIMWDVLSGDFDQTIPPQQCYQNTIKHSKKGSIVVFHDNIKAARNLRYTLPRVLDYFQNRAWVFRRIPVDPILVLTDDGE